MRSVSDDVRVALRGFRRTPGFAAATIAILAIGIGMAITMGTAYRALLVARMPVADQARLVVPRPLDQGGVAADPAASNLPMLARGSSTYAAVAGAWHYGAVPEALLVHDTPVSLAHVAVTANFFDVLGARPHLGRLLRPADGLAGAPKVLVLSYAGWRRHFGGDPGIVGQRVHHPIYDQDFTIVGVAPPGLDFPNGVDYWDALGPESGSMLVQVVARLTPSAGVPAAREEFARFMRGVDDARHVTGSLIGADVRPLADEMVGKGKAVIVLLTAAVALLLLITCVNVGGLLFVRTIGRSREIAIRRAIGASATDIVRQVLVEGALLALAGGAAGLLLATAALRALAGIRVTGLARLDALGTQPLPIELALVVTAAALALFSVLPAVVSARGGLGAVLRADTRAGAVSPSRRLVRQGMVVLQLAVALGTLTGAGLLARSVVRLERQDLGYEPEHLLIFYLSYPYQRYASEDALYRLGDAALARIRAVPGVVAAAPIVEPPFLGDNLFITKLAPLDASRADADRTPYTPFEVGDEDYFRTLAIPVVRGRGFLPSDDATAPKVVVVSQSLADRLWPGRDPLGQQLVQPADTTNQRWTVVGVAKDSHYRKLRESSPIVYEPWRQSMWNPYVAVRIRGDTKTVIDAMQREMFTIDRGLYVSDARTMDEFISDTAAQPRVATLTMAIFAGIALLLSSIGLYGIVSATVRERTHEWGVRLALGATSARITRDVVKSASATILAGTAVGLFVSAAGTSFLRSFLFGVGRFDAAALLGACAVLAAVGIAAAAIPAARAGRVDPLEALRSE